MSTPETLILRRRYPVPVTFADLRAVYLAYRLSHFVTHDMAVKRRDYAAVLKEETSAIDEVYAVVDGREVRVAVVMDAPLGGVGGRDEYATGGPEWRTSKRDVRNLLEVADEQGYWARPHEVRLDLSPRPVSHGEVARAVLVGQEALERGGVVRS